MLGHGSATRDTTGDSLDMSLSQFVNTLKTATLFGAVLGLGIGCVITFEQIEPCATGDNNKLNDQGDCECQIGYEWCDPNDIDNLNCCDDDIGDGTTTDTDPSTTDPATDTDTTDTDPATDTDTTGDGDGDTTGDGDGDTTGDGDGDTCEEPVLPPESCTPEEEGFYWCTNSVSPECSSFFICEGGVWTENAGFMDESCQFDGFDFAYGCVDDGENVIFECGDGAGTACGNDDPAFCVDQDVIGYCQFGKETHDSCQLFCEEVGIEGVTYEYGECDDSVEGDVACFCCDSGDEGCPV